MVRLSTLCAVVAILGASPVVAPRPTNEEWKKSKAGEAATAADASATQAKMAAVDKVTELLEGLKGKVLADGEAEASTYNKFACFCKDGQKEKTQAITDGTDQKESLTADINDLMSGRKDDDTTIGELEGDIEGLNDDVKEAEGIDADEAKTYGAEKADLESAIGAIENAMKTLKASKPSLLELQAASSTIRNTVAMADALGLGAESVALLQQDPEVEMENYKFHSSAVIETLEKLQKEFRGKKAKSDADEVTRVQEHQMLIQQKTDTIKAKTLELGNTQKARGDKIADIAENTQALTITSAKLLDDQEYLKELYSMCSKKADTWDQRSKVRADELSAISAAITIVKGAVSEKTSGSSLRLAQGGVSVRLAGVVARDEDSMDALEAEAEEKDPTPMTFLQRRLVAKHQHPGQKSDEDVVLKKVSELFSSQGGKLQSTLLTSLASQITTEAPKGMEKIKTLIEELINRLQAEAGNEATQKGWCDKSLGEANQKKVSTASAITELNDSLAKLESDRRRLKTALDQLKAEITELKDAQTEADDNRSDEKTENANAVTEAKAGQAAVEDAIEILEEFYKGAAKEKVLLAQVTKGPADDAPDAGFDNGEAYKGDSAGAGGVLGMLDVIKSDFIRTIKETEKAEAEADADHQAFTEETTASVKSKEATETAKKKEKSGKDAKFDAAKESLTKKTDLLGTTVEELLELKKACVDTGMSYEERVERREQEIDSLRKALCILSAFAEYGPDAGMDRCA